MSTNKDIIQIGNKLILHPSFKDIVNAIRKVNVTISEKPKLGDFDFSNATFPPNGKLQKIENLSVFNLDAKRGLQVSKDYKLTGYDESKLNYLALEGTAVFTSHSLVTANQDDYIPINYLSFYFYTRSENLKNMHPVLSHTADIISQSNFDYVKDRSYFMNNWSLDNSISFIDGPLIGGNMTSYTMELVENLHKKNIIPIFIVKNSESNLVTDNIIEVKNRFNSDLHWSFQVLKNGQRTNFFMYVDEVNPKNAKIFCYLKAYNLSPQRIEFHLDTFKQNHNKIDDLMNLTYYLFLAHGDKKNPQVRPIAIAEKYARAILQMSDSYHLMKSSGLIPIMNQERFGG